MMTAQDGLILALLFGGALMYASIRFWKRQKGRYIQKRGIRAEAVAEALLKAEGYRVVSRQLAAPAIIYVDGKAHQSTIHADFMVRRGFQRYLVEVKTGKDANPGLAHVRRQLLEYHFLFAPDGLLFVDANKKRIHKVTFDRPLVSRWPSVLPTIFVGMLLGASLSLLLVSWWYGF